MKNKILIYLSLLALVVIFYLTLPNSRPKVVVCDVGQGDAILATYKNIQLLVDVGPDNKKALSCLENHLPFWDKTIEVVILTHGDSDHIGGLSDILRSYKVNKFFSNGLLDKEIEQKIYSQKVSQNDIVSVGLFEFEVVWPPAYVETTAGEGENNQNSVAGILTVREGNNQQLRSFGGQDWSMFMSGDIDSETEQRLVWRGVLRQGYGTLKNRVDVLKVSHHGSNTGTSDEVLEILKPEVAVISVGRNNRFGHPTEDILKKLVGKKIEVKRTDIDGEIMFRL